METWLSSAQLQHASKQEYFYLFFLPHLFHLCNSLTCSFTTDPPFPHPSLHSPSFRPTSLVFQAILQLFGSAPAVPVSGVPQEAFGAVSGQCPTPACSSQPQHPYRKGGWAGAGSSREHVQLCYFTAGRGQTP